MPNAPDLETVFAQIHPGDLGLCRSLPRHRRERLAAQRPPSRQLLLDAVQQHALPRLLAAHGRGPARPTVGPEDIERLLACVMTPDPHLAEASIAVLAMRGLTREELLVDLLAPVSRALQERWRRDEASFAELALALGRLQRLLRSPSMPEAPLRHAAPGGTVLVATVPGDMRPFEAAIVADFFRGALWEADCLTARTEEALAERLRERRFDVLALTFGPDVRLGAAALLIRAMRRASANDGLFILACGAPGSGDVLQRLGADAAVDNAIRAVPAASGSLGGAIA